VYNLFIYIENSCFGEMGLRSNFRSAYSNSQWLNRNYVVWTAS